jgi:putative MATE family efflux protein
VKTNKIYILETMPVARAIMHLAIPSVLSMLVNIFYNLTDTFFIGKLNDPYQVAAVSISLPLFTLQMAIAGIFGIGGGSYLSRQLGRKEYASANETVSTSVFTTGILSIILGVAGIALIPQFLSLIGASGNTRIYADRYMLIILLGSPVILLKFTIIQLLRAEGAAKEAMVGLLIGTGMNIVLDPLFIFGFQMGVTGAAVATVLGNASGLLYCLSYYIRKKSLVGLSLASFHFRWECYREILMIGIPASLSQIMMSIGNTISFRLASAYSDLHVAALGVAFRVFSIPIYIFIGISIGIQALVGYTYGAQNYRRMKQSIRTSLLISLSFSAFFTLLFALFPRELILIFIKDEALLELGTVILKAYVFAIPIAAVGMILMTSLQAMGKALPALIVALSRQGIAYIPALFILNRLFEFQGLAFAMPFADTITTTMSFTFVYVILKRLPSHQSAEQARN